MTDLNVSLTLQSGNLWSALIVAQSRPHDAWLYGRASSTNPAQAYAAALADYTDQLTAILATPAPTICEPAPRLSLSDLLAGAIPARPAAVNLHPAIVRRF
jgi:hypothetical protein